MSEEKDVRKSAAEEAIENDFYKRLAAAVVLEVVKEYK